jgi:phage protein D
VAYIGVFSAAKMVITDTGDVVDLWTSTDNPFGISLSYVTSVVIDLNMGIHATITVEMDIPYAEGLRLFSETPFFHRGNVIQVKLGYSQDGYMTPWYSGIVLDPAVSITPNGVRATLKCMGAGALAASRGFIGEHKGNLEDWVNDIGSRFNWLVDIDDASGLQEDTVFTGNGDNFLQLTRTYLAMAGYDFYLANDEDGKATLYVRKGEAILSSTPTARFAMFGQPSVLDDVYPIISWNAPAGNSLFSEGSAGAKAVYMDETGALVNLESREADSEKQALGEESAERGNDDVTDPETGQTIDKTVAEDETSLFLVNIPVIDDSKRESALSKVRDGLYTGALGIQATCSTIGAPLLLPATLAEVTGCGSRFDGNYIVTRVVHTVSASGFDTVWTGTRNALPANSGGKPVEVPSNTQTAE